MNVKSRSRTARVRYRYGRLRDYFKRAPLFRFVADEGKARFFYCARPFSPEDPLTTKGTIIGLNRYNDTAGLGKVLWHDAGSVIIKTPVKSTNRINKVIFGDMTIEP